MNQLQQVIPDTSWLKGFDQEAALLFEAHVYMDQTLERLQAGQGPLPVRREVAEFISHHYRHYTPQPTWAAYVVTVVAYNAARITQLGHRYHKWTFGRENANFARHIL